MDDCTDDNFNIGLLNPSRTEKQADYYNKEISYGSHPFDPKRKDDYTFSYFSRATATSMQKKIGGNEQHLNFHGNYTNEASTEPYCHVKLDSIVKLKDSTKKLLYLLEEIQSKSRSKHVPCQMLNNSNTDIKVKSAPCTDYTTSVTDVSATAIKRLEIQTKLLDAIPTADEDDDCSIFKKLTRKCNCMKQQEYNDFIIHFNDATKYYTSTTGEIIKNLRILKRFLYMGGNYTKHALMFLNEGLAESSYAEKIEIIQGCAHADMCNVFEDVSIIISCIAWPYKYDSYGDTVTQELAAEFIHKLAQLEEGRRYLKFTSKITNDIKKVLKKKSSKLQIKTLESLHATLDEMDPKNDTADNITDTYYRRPGDEGFGNQTMKALIHYKQYMTLGEILAHLDLLNKWSMDENGKTELKNCQDPLLKLFMDMILLYDDSEINFIVADILNNLLSNLINIEEKPISSEIITAANTSTDRIQMQNECSQMSTKKCIMKTVKQTKKRNVSELKLRRKAFGFKEKHVIVVPIEK